MAPVWRQFSTEPCPSFHVSPPLVHMPLRRTFTTRALPDCTPAERRFDRVLPPCSSLTLIPVAAQPLSPAAPVTRANSSGAPPERTRYTRCSPGPTLLPYSTSK